MAEKKDAFYDVLTNPNMTSETLLDVWGQDATLQDSSYYKNNEKVQEFFTKDGEFQEDAFNQAYKTA
ncbi:MAG: hypothetical protein HUJ56_01520 [Erysipelotrichaceae bacterium]|nr:hypothetical protein [Erysipelotrichaceae bacterium]